MTELITQKVIASRVGKIVSPYTNNRTFVISDRISFCIATARGEVPFLVEIMPTLFGSCTTASGALLAATALLELYRELLPLLDAQSARLDEELERARQEEGDE